MSLLMDALKKAEQEKKEAAKRQQEGGEQSALPEDGTAALDNTWDQELPPGAATDNDNTVRSTTAELELEPITQRELDGDTTAEIGDTTSELSVAETSTEDPTLNVTMNDLALSDISDALEDGEALAEKESASPLGDLQIEGAEDLDETFHGVALANEVDDELFQETIQGEPYIPGLDAGSHSYEETLPGIPAAQLAEDLGSDEQPTPVAAQTVFSATGTINTGTSTAKWWLLGSVPVLIICGAVLYFALSTPINRQVPSPTVAQGVEIPEDLPLPPVPAPPAALPATDSEADTVAMAPAEAQSGELGVGEEPEPLLPEVAPAAPAEQEAIAGDLEITPALADALARQADEAAAAASAPVPEEAAVAQTPTGAETATSGMDEGGAQQSDFLPDEIQPPAALIKITRSKSVDNESQKVNAAYAAYQDGDLETARQAYQSVLGEFPNNRDALLALGALAMNGDDTETAVAMYSQVLRVDPRNELAMAQLISLQQQEDVRRSESALNTMLHANPDKHYLHFALGNIYATETRWPEAQQAFFNAYQHDSSNPDYALNLAVALDHMGQYDTALDYYYVALKLADERPANFDTANVMTRVQLLAGVHQDQ